MQQTPFSLCSFAFIIEGPPAKMSWTRRKLFVWVCVQVDLCVCVYFCEDTAVQVYKCAMAAVPTDWRLF